VKDSLVHQITGKRDLIKILDDEEDKIRNYIKKNRISFSKDSPADFIHVIRYYDSLR